MRLVRYMVALLRIANEPQRFLRIQVSLRQYDLQQEPYLRQRQRGTFFLVADLNAPRNGAPGSSSSCDDASRATTAFHSGPCLTDFFRPQTWFLWATANP